MAFEGHERLPAEDLPASARFWPKLHFSLFPWRFVHFPLQAHIHLLQTAGYCIQNSPVFLFALVFQLHRKHCLHPGLPDISIWPVENDEWKHRHAACFHRPIWLHPVLLVLIYFLHSLFPPKKVFHLINFRFPLHTL